MSALPDGAGGGPHPREGLRVVGDVNAPQRTDAGVGVLRAPVRRAGPRETLARLRQQAAQVPLESSAVQTLWVNLLLGRHT